MLTIVKSEGGNGFLSELFIYSCSQMPSTNCIDVKMLIVSIVCKKNGESRIATGCVLRLSQVFQGYVARFETLCKCYHERVGSLSFWTSDRFWGFWTLLNPPDATEHCSFLGFMGTM